MLQIVETTDKKTLWKTSQIGSCHNGPINRIPLLQDVIITSFNKMSIIVST